MQHKKKFFKIIAHSLLLSLGYQLVFPACAYALTTGPSQPEVQSFEPVGTTEMVDMFTGDFNYNIPLLDVEGYPVNIFYHSGVGIEQEASWVGLGWNINPGEINRTVRGLPDDFKGEKIEKTLSIKQETDIRIGIGGNAALEIFGKDLGASAGAGLYIAHNNYRGLSSGFNLSTNIKSPVVSVGVGLGVGTQSGADIDLSAAITPALVEKNDFGIAVGGGIGYNSRSGLKDLNLTTSMQSGVITVADQQLAVGSHFGTSIPIGVQNYVPVTANRVMQQGIGIQYKVGLAFFGTVGSAYIQGNRSTIDYERDGSLNAYGYLYLQESDKADMLDFSREKDGTYNETVKNLPLSALSYDVYSVNGHGTGGMFRPFRNDIGLIHDPYRAPRTDLKKKSGQLEGGGPGADYGEIGDDFTWIDTKNESGPWPGLSMDFTRSIPGSLYENVFFKQAGELTYNQQQEAAALFNATPHFLNESLSALVGKDNASSGFLPNVYEEAGMTVGRILWNNSAIDRSSRATNIAYQTAEQIMAVPEMLPARQIASHSDATPFYEPAIVKYNRYGSGTGGRKEQAHHISEFTQTMPDGRRYVYGIPALNNMSREVTFAIDEGTADIDKGYVNVGGNDREDNGMGRDHFYSSAKTPAHAHAYLLTALLSADYVDILGDGPTDDDLGTYVKYNYTRKSDDYRWRAPYESDKAQYNPGFWSDTKDGKGNYVVGSREQWMIRTIETKNYIAEFYTSARNDAKGIVAPIESSGDYSTSAGTGKNLSYKLDEIRLYNKHDRHINKENAVPVKTVLFKYNYSLCKGIPNGTSGEGKLTLHKIFIKYGNSQKNLLSPYVFEYKGQNPDYNFAAKDRWGNYKKVVPGIHNYEFPYTEQPDVLADQDALLSSWNLTDITLPSGGKIKVTYESDDYSFVQDKRSMQMLHITGVGRSAALKPQNLLYTGESDVNQFIYFKRRATENANLSLKDNYIAGQDKLYYSFAVDVANCGKYEPVRGYATIDEVGVCDNTAYAYVKLRKDPVNQLQLHPATVLGINMGRYYLPHIFYDGYTSEGIFDNLLQLLKTFPELVKTIGGENPFREFVKRNKANKLKLANSFIRVQTPGLTKRGGGIRVKELVLSDNWGLLSGNEDASYGRQYDYTMEHERYGHISSGVASYEPMIGADENPFRQPIPYSAESGRLIPSIDFFQEEPFGESFFPAPSVGYSNVNVRSIHREHSRSAQALDEYLFYTAKDYPIIVDYTQKDPGGAASKTSLNIDYREAKVRQGYCIRMNDMHGKPKAVNNYVMHSNGVAPGIKKELITGSRYYYNEDAQHTLSNNVNALVRKRGTENSYEVRNVLLGQDVDFNVDSRYRSSATLATSTSFNTNVLNYMGVPTPIPTFWVNPPQESTRKFHSLVTTKMVQQYGILSAIETIDHGAKTRTDHLVYDAETGTPLLTRTSNEFNDYTGNLVHPAYLAYEGMRPAYTNDAYEEVMDSLVVGYDRNGYLYTDNFSRFTPGDELLVKTKIGNLKLWVLGTGVDVSKDPTPPPVNPTVSIAMFRARTDCRRYTSGGVSVKVYNASTNALVGAKFLEDDIVDADICGDARSLTLTLPPGSYKYTVTSLPGTMPKIEKSGTFSLASGPCLAIKLADADACPAYGGIIVRKEYHSGWVEHKDSDYDITGKWGYYSYKGYIRDIGGSGYNTVQHCNVPEGAYIISYLNGTKGPYLHAFPVLKNKTTEITIHQDFAKKPWATSVITTTGCDTAVSSPPPGGDVVGGSKGDVVGSGGSGGGGIPSGFSRITKEVDVVTESGTERKRCALLVAPRFKDQFSGATNVSSWSQTKQRYSKVHVKVLRSGRRNNLTQSVQQTAFAATKDGFDAAHVSGLSPLFDKTANLLSTSVQTYTDQAQMYAPFSNEINIEGGYKYGVFNPYVLGVRGNFRVQSTFVPLAERSSRQYARQDGVFACLPANLFWSVQSGRTVASTVCDGPTDLLAENPRSGMQYWKAASTVTRYDVFGTAVEEQDAIGNYSAAQYGYNKSLPVAVASNAKYQHFMFEGFEDYSMLLPEKIAALFLKGEQHSAFAMIFGDKKTGSGFSMYDQKYFLRDLRPSSSSAVLVKDTSHSGYYSMFARSATTSLFNVGDVYANDVGAFRFCPGKKYLVQLWAKKLSGLKFAEGDLKVEHHSTVVDMKVKTGSIDGWYQLEAAIDILPGSNVRLKIPAGTYIDDMRALPMAANMKAFVYDPLSFRLVAQLDQNNFATFFEYDQEGLLIRTKKETAKGIMTISESRRANTKVMGIGTSTGP